MFTFFFVPMYYPCSSCRSRYKNLTGVSMSGTPQGSGELYRGFVYYPGELLQCDAAGESLV